MRLRPQAQAAQIRGDPEGGRGLCPRVSRRRPRLRQSPGGRARAAPAKAAAPANAPPPANGTAAQDTSEAAARLARDIDRALNEGRTNLLSEEALQALMAAVCRSYSAQIEAGGSFPPLASRSRVTST